MPWMPVTAAPRSRPPATATATAATYQPPVTKMVGASRNPRPPLRGRAITRAAKKAAAKKSGATGVNAPKTGAYHEESVHDPDFGKHRK